MRISDWSSDVCSSDLAFPTATALCHRQPLSLFRALLRHIHGSNGESGCGCWRLTRTDSPLAPIVHHPGPRNRLAFRRSASAVRSEEHTSELQSLMRISYAVFCLKKKKKHKT